MESPDLRVRSRRLNWRAKLKFDPKRFPMALLIVTLVLIIISGASYFGRPISKRLWLVLLILSVLALVIVLLAYRNVGI